FKITPDGNLTTLYSFNGSDGSHPMAGLIEGGNGVFYGTTAGGGDYNRGTVFRMASDGTVVTLVSFNGANGASPVGALIEGNAGNFYGTTGEGGPSYDPPQNYGLGTVFQVTPGGTLISLLAFDGTNGEHPEAPLLKRSDGNFY